MQMNTHESSINIISRNSIQSLHSVIIDGNKHYLGVHKDFRKDVNLKQFLPDRCRLSIAWVYLKKDEKLDVHEHPIETLIIICNGSGKMIGDLEKEIHEGDVITIRRGAKHGFIGGGENGYWALSLQLEERGLYENAEEALVSFKSIACDDTYLSKLMKTNQEYMQDYLKNSLFTLILSDSINDKKIRCKLLDCIQVWSDIFQHVVMSRYIFTSDDRYKPLALTHLMEEYGHNRSLQASRKGEMNKIQDPILQATSEWFAYKMHSYSDIERLVLVHFVLEGSANAFHHIAHPIMQSFQETKHFEVHSIEDDDHMNMGLDLLTNLNDATYDRLMQVLKESWAMMNALCGRMAELSVNEDQS